MRSGLLVAGAALAALLIGVRPAPAQPPVIVNTTLTTRAVAGSLDREMAAAVGATSEATWFAWSVPSAETDRGPCCWSGNDGGYARCGCQLEDRRATRTDDATGTGSAPGTGSAAANATAPAGGVTGQSAGVTRPAPVPLEGGRRLVVLARVENRAVQKFAAYSADCDLDAGGRPVVWLDGVTPADSVAYLARQSGSDSKPGQGSTPAPAPGVTEARRDGRANRNADVLLMALSMHADPSGIPALIRLAKDAPMAQVRAQSIFWLAQRAGAKAASTITGAIENDPDTEVKVRAVFALSQLPNDEGVPLLIGLARTNRNPQVRRQAMFWLGQSKDPRALAFFEEVLLK